MDLGYVLGGDFEADLFGVIYEYAEIIIGDVERDIFVGLLCECAAVFVDDSDALAVPDEVAEALAQAIDMLADTKAQLLSHEAAIIAVDKCERAFA